MTAKRIVVAGGSGFVGRRLVRRLLDRRDLVTVLSREPNVARSRLPAAVRVAGYVPTERGPWFEEVAHADALVNLAGEQAVGVRWTEAKKKEIQESRIAASEVLVQAIEETPERHRPKVLVGASAVGFYGPRGPDEEIDETTSAGRDFLALLAERWEAAQDRALSLGVRVVHARLGVVFGRGGGALVKMARPFRMHVGGPIGSGRQIISWVHIDDVAGLLLLAIDKEDVRGALNVTSPHPASMEEVADGIGIILHRRSYLRVPEGAVRAMFGEGADALLTGQKVLPKAAERYGYEFQFPELIPALEEALGPDR